MVAAAEEAAAGIEAAFVLAAAYQTGEHSELSVASARRLQWASGRRPVAVAFEWLDCFA